MDERPKRNRDKYNPYYLQSDVKNNIYGVTFSSGKNKADLSITKEIFYAMDDYEKMEANQIQWAKRHIEQSVLYEDTLYKRALIKPISVEEEVDNKIKKEHLLKAINTLQPLQKRRIELYFYEKLSYSQIAKKEGCSKVAVKYSIDLALRDLKKFFSKNFKF